MAERRPARDPISFGDFRLFPTERLLERDGRAVAVGSRALDILLELVEHAGEVVASKDLIAHAWPGITVHENGLRVQIAGLRKLLGEGVEGARYISNAPGRGYSFVAPIDRSKAMPRPSATASSVEVMARLPPRLSHVVGRDDEIAAVSGKVLDRRFVTIVGAGGLGKTTVAIEVAHALLHDFAQDVFFVDLGQVGSPDSLATTISTALGLPFQDRDPLGAVIAHLRETRILLVLDGGEHLIEPVAALAEQLYRRVAHLHILATSREAFRVEGEQVFPLPPLAGPPDDSVLTAIQQKAFPAVQLFIEHAAASGGRLAFTDAEVSIIAGICARLDGNPLAIEIVAGRVGVFGIEGIAKLLQQRFEMRWHGRRTAIARHRTLNDLLDWSYDLLSEEERTALRRLSIFTGPFTLEAAQSVGAERHSEELAVIDMVGSLVERSLLSVVDAGDGAVRYKLLGMTRAYASKKLAESSEANIVARRHAAFLISLLGSSGPDRPLFRRGGASSRNAPHIGDVRASLDWCFGEHGDPSLRAGLAAGGTALFAELSLLAECHLWSARALADLDAGARGGYLEMYLQETLALSALFGRGNDDEVAAAISRALEIARERSDRPYQLRLLAGLNISLTRVGDFGAALVAAEQWQAVARESPAPSTSAVAERMLGTAHHFTGEQGLAQQYYETAFNRTDADDLEPELFGFSHGTLGLVGFARTLWLRGYPERAAEFVTEAINAAEKFGRPVNLCLALLYATRVFLWSRDWEGADRMIERLIAHAERYSLDPLRTTGLGLRGELLVRTGEPLRGEQLLQQAVIAMGRQRQRVPVPAFAGALAEALAATGRADTATKLIEDTIAQAEGKTFDLPELFRLNGELLTMSGAGDHDAEQSLLQSLSCARQQSALSWELRTATTLASFWAARNSADEARVLLADVLDRFPEGSETPDVADARSLLAKLHR